MPTPVQQPEPSAGSDEQAGVELSNDLNKTLKDYTDVSFFSQNRTFVTFHVFYGCMSAFIFATYKRNVTILQGIAKTTVTDLAVAMVIPHA